MYYYSFRGTDHDNNYDVIIIWNVLLASQLSIEICQVILNILG